MMRRLINDEKRACVRAPWRAGGAGVHVRVVDRGLRVRERERGEEEREGGREGG